MPITHELKMRTSWQSQRSNQPCADRVGVGEVLSWRHAAYNDLDSIRLDLGPFAHPVSHSVLESHLGDEGCLSVQLRLLAADGDVGARRASVLRLHEQVPAH